MQKSWVWWYVCEVPALGREVEISLANTVSCRPRRESVLKKKDGWDEWYIRKDIYMPLHACAQMLTCMHVCVCKHTHRHS